MNRNIYVVTSFLTMILIMFFTSAYAGGTAAGQFEKMKQLAGNWQGTSYDGKTVKVTYEVVSNGSVVMERVAHEGEPDMITMYHMDGSTLMMTHYCSAMNQPRMVADPGDDGNVVNFTLKDITNLADKKAGHMRGAKLTIKGNNTLVHQWTYTEAGKEMSVPMELTRADR